MTCVVVETPPGREAAWSHILGIVLGDWLGLDWQRSVSDRRDARIMLRGAPGEVVLPADFLSLGDDVWLSPASLPQIPLASLTSSCSSDLLSGDALPIVFGTAEGVVAGPDVIRLPLDIFGSAFFMLSRYEEFVLPARDDHDRFPSNASLAAAADFVERPLVDEYVELLWAAMSRLWPGLRRRTSSFRMILSHDVDTAGKYGPGPLWRGFQSVAGDVIRRRQLAAVIHGTGMVLSSRSRLHEKDPFNTFDWLMDMSEAHGTGSAFYFIAGRTMPALDAIYKVEDPSIRDLMRRIHARGHEIGLHPSYGTYRTPTQIQVEADRLRRVCAQEGIVQNAWGGRMHYLRWDAAITAHAWADAGMSYDTTLGFADRAGFRCGSAREFRMYDLAQDRSLDLIQRPLIAMESTVISPRYMNLGYGPEAFDVFVRLKQACRKVKGNFCLLWHNSHFTTPADRELYSAVLAA